jgi:GT2 family glycosyltransferase
MILNWNGWDDTVECVASVVAADTRCPIWVIDNGSIADRSAEILGMSARVRVIKLGGNFGWTGGYNRALKVARDEGYEYAYLLNNDAIAGVDFLEEAVTPMRSNPCLAAVGSVVVHAEDPRWVHFDGAYHGIGETTRPKGGAVLPVDLTNGAGMALSLQAFATVGPFDEHLFCYGDEDEWCHRAAQRGMSIGVATGSVIAHRRGGSDRNASSEYYRARNRLLLRRLHPHTMPNLLIQSYFAVRNASEFRRRGRQDVADAIAQGLIDGLRGRGGPRGTQSKLASAIPYIWPFPSGAFRRRLQLLSQGVRLRRD